MNRSPQGGGLAGLRGSLSGGIGRIVLGAVVVLLLLCACGFFAVKSLFGGGGNSVANEVATVTAVAKAGATRSAGPGSGPQILSVTTTTGVGTGNHPLNTTTTFPANAPVVYVVADTQNIRNGDKFAAVWTRDGQPYLTSTPISAPKDFPRTFIEFHIQPAAGNLPVGKYSVQLLVNDKPAQQATFTVR